MTLQLTRSCSLNDAWCISLILKPIWYIDILSALSGHFEIPFLSYSQSIFHPRLRATGKAITNFFPWSEQLDSPGHKNAKSFFHGFCKNVLWQKRERITTLPDAFPAKSDTRFPRTVHFLPENFQKSPKKLKHTSWITEKFRVWAAPVHCRACPQNGVCSLAGDFIESNFPPAEMLGPISRTELAGERRIVPDDSRQRCAFWGTMLSNDKRLEAWTCPRPTFCCCWGERALISWIQKLFVRGLFFLWHWKPFVSFSQKL